MKRKIGISLIVLINGISIFLIVYFTIITFGLIVAPVGEIHGGVIAQQSSINITFIVLTLLLIVSILNLIIFKTLIKIKRALLINFILVIIQVGIFIPFYLSALNSYIVYQNGTTQLSHFINKESISEINIVNSVDTTMVEDFDLFLNQIGVAKHKSGVWKFRKEYKIIMDRTDGSVDSIMTNGETFGPYKGRYFFADSNVVENYIHKPLEFNTLQSDLFQIAKFDTINNWLQRIFIVTTNDKIKDTTLIQNIICTLKTEYPLTNKSCISFFTELKYADYNDYLSLSSEENENWFNAYYLGEFEFSSNKYTTYPTSYTQESNSYILQNYCKQ